MITENSRARRYIASDTTMMSGATLMALFFLWPSTSARHGGTTRSTFGVGLLRLPQYLPLSTSTRRANRRGLADHLQARASHNGYFLQASQKRPSKIAESLEALTSLRGGESSGEVSVLTLLVRVFLPSFRREREATKGVLDLEGGGLMRRIARFMSGILRNVRGFAGSTDAKAPDVSGAKTKGGKKETGKGKGKGKGKQATDSHLQTTYRPGNANYRIQKELKEFLVNPPDGCKVSVGKNIRVWIITISGAEGTIYAGEKFRLRVAFPEDYPTKPPAVYFLQSPPPPKHQHIYTNGDICLSLLSSRDWKPNLTVMSLALSILSMLSSAKEKRIPEDNAAHADSRPGQAQQWIYHDDLC